MKSQSYFAVVYRYYQYNGGSADNGHFAAERRCGTPAEAITLADSINAAAKRRKYAEDRLNASQLARALRKPVEVEEMEDDEEQEYADRDLTNDLISGAGGGYLISAEAQVVRIERKPLR